MPIVYLYLIPTLAGASLCWAISELNDDYAPVAIFGLCACILAVATAGTIHALILLAKKSTTGNRRAIVAIFGPLVVAVQLAEILLTLCTGIYLVLFSYFIPVLLTRHYLPKITLLLAIATAYGSYKILRVLISARPRPETVVSGELISRTTGKQLWAMIDEIAKKADTTAPERIVLSADDNIFVTEAPVRLHGEMFHGRTMVLSLPLTKLLPDEELAAVIAHEMAHFSGADTEFSLKFFPIFKTTKDSFIETQKTIRRFGLTGAVAFPAIALSTLFLNGFGEVEADLSRKCEKTADLKAAEMAGRGHLARALCKIHGIGFLWIEFEAQGFELFRKTRELPDRLCKLFWKNIETVDVKAKIHEIAQLGTAHPFRTHPPLKERIAYLGEEPGLIDKLDRIAPLKPSNVISRIENLDVIENALNKVNLERYNLFARYLGDPEPSHLKDAPAAKSVPIG